MNLEQFGVQEMSLNQQQDVDGGIIPLIIGCVLLIAATNSCSTNATPGCATTRKVVEDRKWPK